MTPEQRARQQIDLILQQCGWIIQDRSETNLAAGPGVATGGAGRNRGSGSDETSIEGYKTLAAFMHLAIKYSQIDHKGMVELRPM